MNEQSVSRPWTEVVEQVLKAGLTAGSIHPKEVDGFKANLLNEAEPFVNRTAYLIYLADLTEPIN